MRVLLDEDLPVGLTRYLAPHQAEHVSTVGWTGLSNGELLRAAGRRASLAEGSAIDVRAGDQSASEGREA